MTAKNSGIIERLTRSSPDSLAATLAAEPSRSLLPVASFLDFARNDKKGIGFDELADDKVADLESAQCACNRKINAYLKVRDCEGALGPSGSGISMGAPARRRAGCVFPTWPDTAASKVDNTRRMTTHLWRLTVRVR
jgi:hypothetical protein